MAYTTIDDPSAHFQTAIWNGTGSALSVVFDGNSDLQPDMVWVKNRTLTSDHRLTDSVRGTSAHSVPNGTDAEDSSSTALTAFNSDGFSVGNEQSYSRSGHTHVGWGWKESAAAGFDIVSFTTSGDDENFSHSLGVIPELIVLKPRASSGNWIVCGNFSGTTFGNQYMTLNTTDASASDGSYSNPTSSQFSTSNNIAPDSTHMAYLFTLYLGVIIFCNSFFFKRNTFMINPIKFTLFITVTLIISLYQFQTFLDLYQSWSLTFNLNYGIKLFKLFLSPLPVPIILDQGYGFLVFASVINFLAFPLIILGIVITFKDKKFFFNAFILLFFFLTTVIVISGYENIQGPRQRLMIMPLILFYCFYSLIFFPKFFRSAK